MDGVKVTEGYDENGKVKITVSSTERKTDLIVVKSNDGYPFFSIAITKGSVPQELKGFYSTPFKARDAILNYLRNYKTSRFVERDRKYEKKKNDSAVLPESV